METLIKAPVIVDELAILWPAQPHEMERDVNKEKTALPDNAFVEAAEVIPSNNFGKREVIEEPQDKGLIDQNFITSPLLSESHSEIQETKLRQLENQARDEGYQKGIAEAELKYEAAINSLSELVEAGKNSISSSLGNVDALIGSIVFEVVCKIIGNRLIQVETCKEVILQVIKNTQYEDILSLKISPEDYERLQKQALDLNGNADFLRDTLKGVKVEADSSIALGGCVVKLKDGLIDGTIETQLQLFANSIKEVVSQG